MRCKVIRLPFQRDMATCGTLAIALLMFSSAANAAILSGTVNTALPATPASDLTALGTVDWAYWGKVSSASSSTQALINRKATGPGIFSEISPLTGTLVRGGISSDHNFTFSDGLNAPTTLSTNDAGLIFNSALDTIGRGVSFTVQGDPLAERQILVWGSGTNGQGTFTASLNGATPVTLLGQSYTGKTGTLFTINFKPDNISDLLTLSYALSTDTGTNAHVGFIAATAATVIPEPSTLALGCLGLFGSVLLARRKG